MNFSRSFLHLGLALIWLGCALALTLGFSTAWISLVLLGALGISGLGAFPFRKSTDGEQRIECEINNEFPPPSTVTEDSYARASFLAKVSHELRTPLHNILGLLNIVYKNDANATNRYYLRLIHDASSALLGTINDVLDYSKSDTGMLTVEAKPIDLSESVRQALRTVSPKVADKVGLELLCSWGKDVPTHVRSDSVRLRQVLVNLLGNAIKFTTSGQVKLTVSIDGETNDCWKLRFCVSDTGIGIPASKINSIFDPFSQVDMTVVRRVQGTGLGLTIVKQLVTALKGEISVTSTLGEGSQFTVTVPMKKDTAQESPKLFLAEPGTLCVLSGDTPLADLLCQELLQYGAQPVLTNAPLSFLQIAAKNITQLVVTDTVLTEEKSWRMIDDFLEQRGETNLVILLTPASIQFRERCTQLGIRNILTLPAISRDIVASLNGNCPEEQLGIGASARVTQAREPLNVLIADDIATNQLILRTVLEEAGHKVRAVSDGEVLFDLIRNQVEGMSTIAANELFDVILTDIQMPKMDGITVIQRTRELERTHSAEPLPLIAVTAHAFQAEQDRILKAGATGIVTKPLNLRELEELIGSVVRRSKRPSVSSVPVQASTTRSPAPGSFSHHSFVSGAERIIAEADTALGLSINLDIVSVFDRSGKSQRRTLLILKSFLSGYRELLGTLHYREGLTSAEDLGKVAHSLKGLLSEVGATTAQAVAAEAEKIGGDGRLSELLPLLDSLKRETELVASVVRVVVEKYDEVNGEYSPMTP